MNVFERFISAAKQNQLPGVSPQNVAYYASEAFSERVQFTGEAGHKDQLAILLFMLKHEALDERDATRSRELLRASGLAVLRFWQSVSPVLTLEVPVGSSEQAQLLQAVNENLEGRFARAGLRVRRRHGRRFSRWATHDAVLAAFRRSLPPVTAEDYRQNPEAAQARQWELTRLSCEKVTQLHARYQNRMAALERPLSDFPNWDDLIQRIAITVLTPSEG